MGAATGDFMTVAPPRKRNLIISPTRMIMPAESFSKGGEAVLAGYADMFILVWVVTTSILWILYLDRITLWMVGIEGDVFKSTFRTYVDMRNATTEKFNDGIPRREYITLCAATDIGLSVPQFLVSFALVLNGPSPKSLNTSMAVVVCWLIVNIPIYLAYITWRIYDQNWITLGIGVVVRGGFLLKVMDFTRELRRVSQGKIGFRGG